MIIVFPLPGLKVKYLWVDCCSAHTDLFELRRIATTLDLLVVDSPNQVGG